MEPAVILTKVAAGIITQNAIRNMHNLKQQYENERMKHQPTPITRKAWKQMHTILMITKMYIESMIIMKFVMALELKNIAVIGLVIVACILVLQIITKPIGRYIRRGYLVIDDEYDYVREIDQRANGTVTIKEMA